jgi:glycosyltransferase involved in cell wall biosynthesis
MALRIGINALYLIPGGVGGTEIYLRGLLGGLARLDSVNQYLIFTNRETDAGLVPQAPNFQLRPQPVRAVSRPWRIAWEQTGLALEAARLRLDVMLNPGFTAPLLCGCPQATVFHDLQHKRHPEYFRWFDLPFWRALLFASAHVSRAIIAVSEATRNDVLRYYRVPEARVTTVPQGAGEEFFGLRASPCPEKFILAVSTLHPHKNLDGLLRAFAEFRRARPEYRLVVAGMHGFFSGPLHELRESLGLGEAIDFPGWIPRADLLDLFSRASAFVYPSFFEGFGIPVVEALAAGLPSACSNIEPMAGIAGDAALLFDPRDTGAIRDAMLRLTGDQALRAELAVRGPARARAFSWDRTAAGTLDVLTRVASIR